ncbi:MAG: succinate dehydrogenase assembly factor 2 [Filomicrobium sp.]
MQDIETRRRRALYRAQYRGTKEMDIVMSRYANERVPTMSEDDMTTFEKFLAVAEPQLDDWIMKGKPVGETDFAELVADVRRLNGFD